jgi:hypothetical protein
MSTVEAAIRFDVPLRTVQSWNTNLSDLESDTSTPPAEPPAWMPTRLADREDEAEALLLDFLHGQRVVLAWLSNPQHLTSAHPQRIDAVLRAHNSLSQRLVAIIEWLQEKEDALLNADES